MRQLKTMVLARPSSRASEHPRPGDRILIFKPQWLQLVLSGDKSMEVRGAAYKSGKYYFGCQGFAFFLQFITYGGRGCQVSSMLKPISDTHFALKA